MGLVDNARLLVQQDTELLLINIGNLGRDLFYQLVRPIIDLQSYLQFLKQKCTSTDKCRNNVSC